MRNLEYRVLEGTGRLIATPFYVDDDLRARIVLGEHAKRWPDIRPMLEQTESTAADHESADRLSHAALRAITRIDEAHAAAPLRPNIRSNPPAGATIAQIRT